MIEVVRGFLYPKYIVRTSSGCTRIDTFSFMLWCDKSRRKERKIESKKYDFRLSIYILKGPSEIRADAGSA